MAGSATEARDNVERRLRALLDRPIHAREHGRIARRRADLRAFAGGLDPRKAKALLERLDSPREELADRFEGELHPAVQREVRRLLRNRGKGVVGGRISQVPNTESRATGDRGTDYRVGPPLRPAPEPTAAAVPHHPASNAVVARVRSLLSAPVPDGSTERKVALETFFESLSPLEAARLHAQLSDPGDPLRVQINRRMARQAIPDLLETLALSSGPYTAQPAPEDLADRVLEEEFLALSAPGPPSPNRTTTVAQAEDEARRQELYAEIAERGLAYAEMTPQQEREVALHFATQTGDYSQVDVDRVMHFLPGGTKIRGLPTSAGYYRLLDDRRGFLEEVDQPPVGTMISAQPLRIVHQDEANQHLVVRGAMTIRLPQGGSRRFIVEFWWTASARDFEGLLFYAHTAAEYGHALSTALLAKPYGGQALVERARLALALGAEGLGGPGGRGRGFRGRLRRPRSKPRVGRAPRGKQKTAAPAADRLAAYHPALPKYLKGRPKIAHDDETLSELAEIFRSTRRSGGAYQGARAASGELAVLEQVHKAGSTTSIRLLRPTKGSGDRTPDLLVDGTQGSYHVEITTPTLARRGQRGPARAKPGDVGTRPRPPVDKTRPATSSEIKEAFLRKIRHGQISKERPGVIVVNVQRAPAKGPVLTAKQIADLEAEIAGNTAIKELLVVVPGRTGRTVLRVGSRDSGLGLAQGVL